MTAEEKNVLDEWKKISEKLIAENPFADTFWKSKDYFKNSSCPWMSGYDVIQGKRYLCNGKVLDKNIKGRLILKYIVHTA